jgi:choice-of-anchor A domain-containing protein/MYXO-CTERM domain-containing protein
MYVLSLRWALAVCAVASGLAPGLASADSYSFNQLTSDFNAVTIGNPATGDNGNFSSHGSDSEGCIAAAGNVDVGSYSVGASASTACRAGGSNVAPIVAGGSVTFNNGSISGNASTAPPIIYGTTDSVSNAGITGTPLKNAGAVDWAATRATITALSTSLGNLSANGTTSVVSNFITLTGSNATTDVFSISGNVLASATGLTINAPATSTVIINVSGTNVTMQNFGISLSGVDRTHVLFNFAQATTLTYSGIDVTGSILAPYAAVSGSGVIHGSLIAASYSGQGQIDAAPFAGAIPAAPARIPEPSSLAIYAVGLVALAAAARRRRRG